MDRDYDIFEVLSAGISIWKATTDSQEGGIGKLEELANGQPNEFRLIHRPTLTVLATRNGPKSQM